MSIAIVAAILACITMLGHREHNQTILLQGEAIQLQTLAGIRHSEESNKWNYFQAQKFRSHMYQVNLEMLAEINNALGKSNGTSPGVDHWKKQVDKYEGRLAEEKQKAEDLDREVKDLQEQAREKLAGAHHAHLRADRFDYGELGVELAVVLCSIAVLTKRKGYWYLGLGCCLAGTLIALTGLVDLFMSTGH
jgi:hypothetical protein